MGVRARSWREPHGLEGGETNADSEVVAEGVAAQGAVVMGRQHVQRRQRPVGAGPEADGWWGEDPPFHVPVFVLTHHAREPLAMQGGTTFTFVTDGIASALEQARAAAGEKDVLVAGGADVVQQYARRRGCSTSCRSTSSPSSSAPASRCWTASGPTRSSRSTGSSTPRRHPPALPRRQVT